MIIACDIDNCINDLTKKAIDTYNFRTGKDIKLSELVSYDFSKCLTQEDAAGICELFKDKELWDSLEPTHNPTFIYTHIIPCFALLCKCFLKISFCFFNYFFICFSIL